MFDLKRTFFSLPLEKPVAAGSVVEQEGLVLLSKLEAGVEKVYVNDAAPANTEVVAGFSLIANAQSDKDVIVVDVVVPAHAPLIGNLGVTNIVSGSIYAGALAIDETFAGAAAPGTVKVNLATGDLKFEAGQAATKVEFALTYNLTVEQSKAKYFQRNINNPGFAYLAQVGVGMGEGEIFTSEFDSSKDYSAAPLTVGAKGVLTTGTALAFPGICIASPSIDSPFLGVRFKI